MTAKIIAIEGSDGVGKATQVEMLVRHLKEDGFKTVSMSFPRYETPTGKRIRDHLMKKSSVSKDPLEISKLYYEDRKNVLPLILKMIRENDFLIFDRYKYSSMAHQAAKADPNKRDEVISKIEEMEKDIPDADLVLILLIPAELSRKMLEKEKIRDLYESNINYQRKTNEIYEKLSLRSNWIKINCVEKGKLLPIEKIHKKIYNSLKGFI